MNGSWKPIEIGKPFVERRGYRLEQHAAAMARHARGQPNPAPFRLMAGQSRFRRYRGMRILSTAVILAALAGAFGGAAIQSQSPQPQPPPAVDSCGTASTAQLRTTLYFGTARPTGTVSELEWQMFLRDEVTSRFPEGLTVWDAQGQWRQPGGRIDQERSKVLLIVHDDTAVARNSVLEVIRRYRKAFEQQSVLWETSRVCVSL